MSAVRSRRPRGKRNADWEEPDSAAPATTSQNRLFETDDSGNLHETALPASPAKKRQRVDAATLLDDWDAFDNVPDDNDADIEMESAAAEEHVHTVDGGTVPKKVYASSVRRYLHGS